MLPGSLYLIPVPLAENATAKSFTPYLVETINHIDEYIVENSKTARRFLKEAGLKIPQSELIIHDYGKHQREGNLNDFFKGLLAGKDVGLMSEAGCPGVADPGAEIVALAHQKGIKVVPLVGPSSILLALMASGFSGQSFTFHGYLPRERKDRIRKMKDMEMDTRRNGATHIFMDTPFRSMHVLEDLLNECADSTQLCIAANLTTLNQRIQTMSVIDWREKAFDVTKIPVIFLIGTAQ
jgi:16S rRNA (cytidine1402-2'-O)-methyltransferase